MKKVKTVQTFDNVHEELQKQYQMKFGGIGMKYYTDGNDIKAIVIYHPRSKKYRYTVHYYE